MDKIEKCAATTFKKLKSENLYQPFSMEVEDTATTQLIPTTQWPKAFKSVPQTKNDQPIEEGGFAANRRKSPTSCSTRCLVIIALVVIIVLIGIIVILVQILKK
ncbi:hypothetical protein SNE40_011113 [Patella caerulea]|uniref:Uncharacterized protein n=1 Tax=Patella caerulea TaxID=87958 RepID=A0AAN8K2C5_PATCE